MAEQAVYQHFNTGRLSVLGAGNAPADRANIAAPNMASTQPEVLGVIHYSNYGCRYTSYALARRCPEASVMPSMGSARDGSRIHYWNAKRTAS